MLRKAIILVAILVILAACGINPATNMAQECPVTTPSEQTADLPTNTNYEGRFWHGTPALWTNLPSDGVWRGLPQDEDGYVQKTVFWHEGFDAISEPQPDLVVSGHRLDAPAPTFIFSDATHGWDETGNFILTGIRIPIEGCWEITAEYKNAQLTYVVEVIP